MDVVSVLTLGKELNGSSRALTSPTSSLPHLFQAPSAEYR